jgi:hypothetical protein
MVVVRPDGPTGPSAQCPRQRGAFASRQPAMCLPPSRPQPTVISSRTAERLEAQVIPAPSGGHANSADSRRRTRRGHEPLSSQMTLRRGARAALRSAGGCRVFYQAGWLRLGACRRNVGTLISSCCRTFRHGVLGPGSYSLDGPTVCIISASSSWMAVSAFSSGVIAPSSASMPPPSAAVPAVDKFAIACV